jgi:hypothetical protein
MSNLNMHNRDHTSIGHHNGGHINSRQCHIAPSTANGNRAVFSRGTYFSSSSLSFTVLTIIYN